MSYVIESMEDNGLIVKDILVWRKTNPMPRNIERRYVQDMEFAIWAVKKGSKWVFNKGDVNYRRSLFETPLVAGKEKSGHPTQKSLRLMEEIMKIHTNVGDSILDPFMGSGTTGVACKNLGRNFTGIEKEKEYYDMALERLM